MTPAQTAQMLSMFSDAWPHIDVSEQTTRLWVQSCADVDVVAGRKAAQRIVREDARFPTISRFITEATSATKVSSKLFWAASPTCPICVGTTMVTDAEGREWVCTCASMERLPDTTASATKAPAELIEAARRALPRHGEPA